MWRSAWLRGARAEPWVWRGRRQVALGGFRGHAPGALAQKCRLFFLSAPTAHNYLSPCPLSVREGVRRRKRRSSSARLSVTWVGRPCGQA